MNRIGRWIGFVVPVAFFFLAFPGLALAAEEPAGLDAGDTAWMMTSCAMVLLMTPGLAFFYGGLVRRKNVLSVLVQCFMAMCIITVAWVVLGYSLAFSGDIGSGNLGGVIGGFDHFLLRGVGYEVRDGTIPHMLFMIFQCMFAIITPALIVGAFAERLKFGAYCVYIVLWLFLVYCPVCHWVWGEAKGFFGLGNNGALDFAGGTVVHINAGVSALVCAIVLGKRQGYPEKTSPPHNLPFAVLGAGLLWFGWFGFNAGSAGAANASASNAFVVTHIATAAAGLTWAILDWILTKKPTCLGIITGVVAGLVAITPASGSVNPIGALCVGGGASIFAFIAINLKVKLKYDDSLDVFGVHGVAGIWGALATGLWATSMVPGNEANGLFYGNPIQLLHQVKAVAFTIVWSGSISFILLKLIDATIGLRAENRNEQVGLDLTEHAETAYTLVD
jgi:Amt family ammonium transporter